MSVGVKRLLVDPIAVVTACLTVVSLVFVSVSMLGTPSCEEKIEKYTFQHCPNCEAEYPIIASGAKVDRNCPECLPQQVKMVPTVGSIKDGTAVLPVSWATSVVLSLVVAVIVQASAILLFQRYRTLRLLNVDTGLRPLFCRCPSCERRIGYVAKRAGTGVQCPHCKLAFLLPEDGQPDDRVSKKAGTRR